MKEKGMEGESLLLGADGDPGHWGGALDDFDFGQGTFDDFDIRTGGVDDTEPSIGFESGGGEVRDDAMHDADKGHGDAQSFIFIDEVMRDTIGTGRFNVVQDVAVDLPPPSAAEATHHHGSTGGSTEAADRHPDQGRISGRGSGSGNHAAESREVALSRARNAQAVRWSGAGQSQLESLGFFLGLLEERGLLSMLPNTTTTTTAPHHHHPIIPGFSIVGGDDAPKVFLSWVALWLQRREGAASLEELCPGGDVPRLDFANKSAINTVCMVFRRAGLHPEKNNKRRGYNWKGGRVSLGVLCLAN